MMHVIPIYQSSHVLIMIVVLFVIQVNLHQFGISCQKIIKVLWLGYPTSLPLRLLPHVRSKPGLRHPQNITIVSLQEYQANSSEMSDGAMVYVKIKLTSKEMWDHFERREEKNIPFYCIYCLEYHNPQYNIYSPTNRFLFTARIYMSRVVARPDYVHFIHSVGAHLRTALRAWLQSVSRWNQPESAWITLWTNSAHTNAKLLRF